MGRTTHDGKMGGVIDTMGAKVIGDLPLLEVCCQFYKFLVSKVRGAEHFVDV